MFCTFIVVLTFQPMYFNKITRNYYPKKMFERFRIDELSNAHIISCGWLNIMGKVRWNPKNKNCHHNCHQAQDQLNAYDNFTWLILSITIWRWMSHLMVDEHLAYVCVCVCTSNPERYWPTRLDFTSEYSHRISWILILDIFSLFWKMENAMIRQNGWQSVICL